MGSGRARHRQHLDLLFRSAERPEILAGGIGVVVPGVGPEGDDSVESGGDQFVCGGRGGGGGSIVGSLALDLRIGGFGAEEELE